MQTVASDIGLQVLPRSMPCALFLLDKKPILPYSAAVRVGQAIAPTSVGEESPNTVRGAIPDSQGEPLTAAGIW